jgi:hypothetical protein
MKPIIDKIIKVVKIVKDDLSETGQLLLDLKVTNSVKEVWTTTN